ncbi:hypothetical protein NC651_034559 [Populus alba x Populus x berolinensis]|nr:hypothetical protein NC651_034559 [Populus alba x Populus x berolinensis]
MMISGLGVGTRNPWNTLRSFSTWLVSWACCQHLSWIWFHIAIGSETAGSITYPATRLWRDSIASNSSVRVGRTGVMSLAESLAKAGNLLQKCC